MQPFIPTLCSRIASPLDRNAAPSGLGLPGNIYGATVTCAANARSTVRMRCFPQNVSPVNPARKDRALDNLGQNGPGNSLRTCRPCASWSPGIIVNIQLTSLALLLRMIYWGLHDSNLTFDEVLAKARPSKAPLLKGRKVILFIKAKLGK